MSEVEMRSGNQVQPDSDSVKSSYLENVRFCGGVLFMSADFVSDMVVLYKLLKGDHWELFLVGLLFDLLPGPITALQMYLHGYGLRKSLALLVHPLNILMQSFLVFHECSTEKAELHKKIFTIAKECQGLLEAPLQIIFTFTLMANRILPLPWDEAEAFVYVNAHGHRTNLSFIPLFSALLSILMVIYKVANTVTVFEYLEKFDIDNLGKGFNWLYYLVSTIPFRLAVWVLLWTYLAENTIVIVVILLAVNFFCIYFMQEKLNFDPILGAFISLMFPTV